MYHTCIYCHRNLGRNESLENWPVGRRLAFDQAKGRLWVVCTHCRRWNLTPFEERWEAIEECERRFSDTSRSFSTDNIGLARLPEGMELIRVGKPPRKEFAAWRYAKQLTRRQFALSPESVLQGTYSFAYSVMMLAGSVVPVALPATYAAMAMGLRGRVIARVRLPGGLVANIRRRDLDLVQLAQSGHEEGFALTFKYRDAKNPWWKITPLQGTEWRTLRLYGAEAIRTAGLLLPHVNHEGGTRRQVNDAVDIIAEAGGPRRLFTVTPDGTPKRTWVVWMPRRLCLALEMAAHEESERWAIEGELTDLEHAWREAEEIAAIADRLLIPAQVEEWIKQHTKR